MPTDTDAREPKSSDGGRSSAKPFDSQIIESTAFRVTYYLYVIGIAIFALVAAIFAVFEIFDVAFGTEVVALLALAIVAPLVPAARQFVFPGGFSLILTEDKSQKSTEQFRSSAERGVLVITNIDLEHLWTDVESNENGQ